MRFVLTLLVSTFSSSTIAPGRWTYFRIRTSTSLCPTAGTGIMPSLLHQGTLGTVEAYGLLYSKRAHSTSHVSTVARKVEHSTSNRH